MLFATALKAQLSNWVVKKIATKGVIQLGNNSIVPNSLVMENIDTNAYTIHYFKAQLEWKKTVAVDSVIAKFRTFPFSFTNKIKRFSYDSVRNNFLAPQSFIFNNSSFKNNTDFDFGNVQYNGSFGRSLSFGNSQDAVFNSQLNLQINGLIGDSIQLSAAITDNNIPIQPDGTTQQLNEFDRIWLQFKKQQWELNLGDIDIRENDLYFLSFYKRLQGISFEQKHKIGKQSSNRLLVSGAIAKGKFTRNIFQGQEGNQGPYRIQSANGELFFVVLANTERIFIDGELLQRGEDQDYIINYNTAEITFTPKRMITKDRRIQVEFEYADRNYLNAFLYASNTLQINKKLSFTIGAYNNNDAKNSPINQTLDNPQKQFLAAIGDSIQNAFYQVASIDSFATNKILYAKRIAPNNIDSIFVYSTNKDSAKYNLNFIEVGQNRGNYVPLFNGANGKVYQYIPPINGVKQGNFEPATFLVTPKKQQLVSMNLAYQVSNNTKLIADIALSNYDVNTFSSKDKTNNTGYAGKMQLQNTKTAFIQQKKIAIVSSFGYEWVNEQFKPLERLRTVEFARDWGLPFIQNANNNLVNEHLPTASVELKDQQENTFKYAATGYFRSDNYNGFKQQIQHIQRVNGWELKSHFNFTNIETNTEKGFFLRPSIQMQKTFSKWNNYVLGITYELEHNEQKNKQADTITANSFAFDIVTAYIKSNEQKNNRFTFSYTTRSDVLPLQQQLKRTDRSHNYNFLVELLQSKKHQLRGNITYRQLNVFTQQLTNLKADNSVLGRIEYAINEWNGFITGNSLYEIGSGQEQRRDFTYVEVQAGRGEYAWNDYNNDGIQQLNEFEIAIFQDQAKYIRIFTPTNNFVKANYAQFNYSLLIQPKAILNANNKSKWHQFLSKFSLQSALQTSSKQLASGSPTFNPFNEKIADTALIYLNSIFNNTLSFNRFSSVWGIDINRISNFNKSLLTYGFESRTVNEWSIKSRWNIQQRFTLEIAQKMGNQALETPSFANRNYAIKTILTEPKLSYIVGTVFRMQVGYNYGTKQNSVVNGGEKSTQKSLLLETRYNALQNSSINVKFTNTNITYSGLTNTTTSYIMLEGLLPGTNYLWNIEFTKRLINNLEINFSYEGRKATETKTIHVGRASIRALL